MIAKGVLVLTAIFIVFFVSQNKVYASCQIHELLNMRPVIGVFGLSRGRGVPGPVSATLAQIRLYANKWKQDGVLQKWDEGILGLEGETVLCLHFLSSEVAKHKANKLSSEFGGIELLNIELGTC